MLESESDIPTLADFVRQLWETGRVGVQDAGKRQFAPVDLENAWLQLNWIASEEQLDLPGRPPALSRPAAEWALLQFYRGCSFLVHRALPEQELRRALAAPCPEPPSPAVCYSVDLTFRFLPDLHRLAKSLAASDPLLEILLDWCRQWPFSSVGTDWRTPPVITVPEQKTHEPILPSASPSTEDENAVPTWDLSAWWEHDCLSRMYVDRVIQRGDVSRLRDQAVADAVRAALGLHAALAPQPFIAQLTARTARTESTLHAVAK